MNQVNPPFVAHPPGVWRQSAFADGSAALVEFGEETSVEVRVWRREAGTDLELTELRSPRPMSIGGVDWQLAAADRDGRDEVWAARADLSPAVIQVSLRDSSGRTLEEGSALLHSALAGLDVSWILARAEPPEHLNAPPERLFPWLLPADHPLAASHTCMGLPNGLGIGVAAVHDPWVVLLGPDHPARARVDVHALLGLATLNLVQAAQQGQIPFSQTTLGDAHALTIGPHPLASACLLLPDLQPLAAPIVGSSGDLIAIPLRRDLLLVCTDRVSVPDDAWAGAVRVVA